MRLFCAAHSARSPRAFTEGRWGDRAQQKPRPPPLGRQGANRNCDMLYAVRSSRGTCCSAIAVVCGLCVSAWVQRTHARVLDVNYPGGPETPTSETPDTPGASRVGPGPQPTQHVPPGRAEPPRACPPSLSPGGRGTAASPQGASVLPRASCPRSALPCPQRSPCGNLGVTPLPPRADFQSLR